VASYQQRRIRVRCRTGVGAAKELRMGALGSTIKLLGSHADVPSTLVNGMNTVVMSTNPTAATLITVFVIISFTNVR
jgi:hypothetical protein